MYNLPQWASRRGSNFRREVPERTHDAMSTAMQVKPRHRPCCGMCRERRFVLCATHLFRRIRCKANLSGGRTATLHKGRVERHLPKRACLPISNTYWIQLPVQTGFAGLHLSAQRSEEHTSELQSQF